MSPLLSIIIPTKDRYKYLKPILELLISYDFNNTEIIIEDNSSDNNEIKKFLGNHKFQIPFKYYHTPHQIPISQNIDNAISHSSGRYVCVLGDDDGVTPLLENYVTWMENNNIESVRQKYELTYKWPSYTSNGEFKIGGTLTYYEIGDKNSIVDLYSEVIKVIHGGIMSLGNMPCVYQGVVKRSVLDKLYKIGGTFFPGPSPDMANAMALSFVVQKHYVTTTPLIISGGSEFQGGRSKQIKSWVQSLDDVPFISEVAKSKWDIRIPYFWCGNTVWPESGIKGLEYVGKSELLKEMDFDLLLAKCLYRGPKYKIEILSKTKNPMYVKLLFYKHWIREYIAEKRRFVYSQFNKIPGNNKRIFNLKSIKECVAFLIKETE